MRRRAKRFELLNYLVDHVAKAIPRPHFEVLMAFYRHAYTNGEFRVSHSLIASQLGLSRDRVAKISQELVRLGIVAEIERGFGEVPSVRRIAIKTEQALLASKACGVVKANDSRFKQLNWIVDEIAKTLPEGCFAAMMAFFAHANTAGQFSISWQHLANTLGISKRHASNLFETLLAGGVIEQIVPGGGKMAKTYRFTGKPYSPKP